MICHNVRLVVMVLALAGTALGAGPASRPAIVGASWQVENVARAGWLLRPRDASSRDGERIVVYPKEDWRCMTWRFEPAGDKGEVRLVNYFTHKTFVADGDKVVQRKAGTDIAAGQRWRFVPVDGEDGIYRIEEAGTGRVLGVDENEDVVAGRWEGTDGQKWRLLGKPERFTG